MRTIRMVVFTALMLTFFGTEAEAQKVRNSTFTGTLVSAAAVIPMEGNSVVIYAVPVGNSFVMTQACAGESTGFGFSIVGTQLGTVPVGNSLDENCSTYSLGIAFQGGEILSCSTEFSPGVDSPCLITGVLQ